MWFHFIVAGVMRHYWLVRKLLANLTTQQNTQVQFSFAYFTQAIWRVIHVNVALGHSNQISSLMDFMNNGMQSVGRHKYEFISVNYAAFSQRITPETLPGHTPGMGVVILHQRTQPTRICCVANTDCIFHGNCVQQGRLHATYMMWITLHCGLPVGKLILTISLVKWSNQ